MHGHVALLGFAQDGGQRAWTFVEGISIRYCPPSGNRLMELGQSAGSWPGKPRVLKIRASCSWFSSFL